MYICMGQSRLGKQTLFWTLKDGTIQLTTLVLKLIVCNFCNTFDDIGLFCFYLFDYA